MTLDSRVLTIIENGGEIISTNTNEIILLESENALYVISQICEQSLLGKRAYLCMNFGGKIKHVMEVL